MHEHFDADGNLTGTTVVTREPEWDESARGRALRLEEYESSICGCGCGQPLSVARDAEQVFVADEFVCHAGRVLDRHRRARDEEAEKQKRPIGWDDGLHYYVRAHDPDIDKPLKVKRP